MKKKILLFLLVTSFLFVGCNGKNSGKTEVSNHQNQVNENQSKTNGNDDLPQSPPGFPLGFDSFMLTGEDMNKNPIDASIFKDKITLVNVWATFCGPCIHELPDLNALYGEYKDQGFQVIGVTIDTLQGTEENMDLAKDIIAKKGISYPIIVPSKDTVDHYLTAIQGVPTSFFVDGEGKVISSPIVGVLSKDKYQKLIESHLTK